LLVLDGLEPLQSAHAFECGKLRDPTMESLLRGLARQSAGLCLITTREPLSDFAKRPGVTMRDLEQINPQAGRALLRTARVAGTDAELEGLASRFGPHALAVSLLGVYLREQPGHGVGPAQALEQLPGKNPIDRVLAGFEQWLGNSPEREALRLLGFFDRPADAGCLRALRMAPAIAGLTDCLAGLGYGDWEHVLARLEKLRLIHMEQDKSGQCSVDAHPLIREHFAEFLKKDGETWREGHRRLYEHLCVTTKDKPQPTLEDLQPLYQAVAHGCQAGMQQVACNKLFYARIARWDEAYSLRKLGAFGSDLGAVACFFESPWSRVSPAITEIWQAWLLNEAAFRLSALGRLIEALEPMRAGLEMGVQAMDWSQASRRAGNLSELELMLGDVAGAVRGAEQSVSYADRSGDAFERLKQRTKLADAVHQAGRRAEAQALFCKAESMQAKRQPDLPLLYSVRSFQYCDLLLAAPQRAAWQLILQSPFIPHPSSLLESCRAVSQRATQTLDWGSNHFINASLLTIALDHLTVGRAALYEVILQNSSSVPCHLSIQQAVNGLHQAGEQQYLPLGLLTRAWLRSLPGVHTNPESAQSDLDEAWEIAERGPMPLFLADIHLYRARLFYAVKPYPWAGDGKDKYGPKDDLCEARAIIVKCGYWRRKEELEDAEEAAKTW
jgi:hypothetical protein